MSIRVGIDLGTTFSAVARINEVSGKPEVIRNSFNSPITPSVLCFEENGNVLFGEDAKSMQGMGNTNAIAFFKRNMGNDRFCVEFFGKTYNATDLSAILLKSLVKEAEQSCGEKIDSAVITVPAYFTHKERQATIEAGKKAGLKVLSIINEPTAAAFAYGLNEKESEKTILIYDLGGGTFDVTIARIDKNKIDILGSDGNHELGGKDWDDCIAGYLAQRFYEEHGIDLGENEEKVASLLVTAESVKKQLTSKDEVTAQIVYKNIRSSITITEELFEDISDVLINLTKDLTDNLIKSIGLSWSDITGVILVGGSTRMRMIYNYVKNMSGKEPLFGVNVDEAVALGAAIRANIDDSGKSVGKLRPGERARILCAKRRPPNRQRRRKPLPPARRAHQPARQQTNHRRLQSIAHRLRALYPRRKPRSRRSRARRPPRLGTPAHQRARRQTLQRHRRPGIARFRLHVCARRARLPARPAARPRALPNLFRPTHHPGRPQHAAGHPAHRGQHLAARIPKPPRPADCR